MFYWNLSVRRKYSKLPHGVWRVSTINSDLSSRCEIQRVYYYYSQLALLGRTKSSWHFVFYEKTISRFSYNAVISQFIHFRVNDQLYWIERKIFRFFFIFVSKKFHNFVGFKSKITTAATRLNEKSASIWGWKTKDLKNHVLFRSNEKFVNTLFYRNHFTILVAQNYILI